MATTQENINRLNKYTEELKLLNKQLEQLEKNTKAYERVAKQKEVTEKKAAKASKDLSTSVSGLNTNLKNHPKLIEEAAGAQDKYSKTTEVATKSTKGFGSRILSSIKTLGAYGVAYQAINLAAQLFATFTIKALQESIKFEAELAKLESVTGASAGEMKILSDNILEVAGNTRFTSSQIVELQTSLGKLGFSTEEIVASTQAIANIAQAIGEDAAPVAERIGQILNQFNLTAAESVQVGDVLVSTINNSALSFESFGTAVQYVGPLAAELGTSFTELSGAMAVLADSGFTASRIGTGLRGILTELGTTGQDLISIIEDLADEEISFADAVDLVGKRSAAQLLTLVDNVEILEEAEERYEETGAAIVASAKQIDTFRGNTELLNSAWNAFLINLGEFYNRVGFVRTALRILDSEAADTAEGLSQVANADPAVVATGFDFATARFRELTAAGMEYSEAVAQAQVDGAQLIAESLYPITDAMFAQAGGVDERKKSLEAQKKAQEQIVIALASEFEGQILNAKLQDERTAIAEEYKDLYDGLLQTSIDLNAEVEKGNLKESERLTFNKEVEEEIEKIKSRKAKIEDGELKNLEIKKNTGIELTDDEKIKLSVLSAQADALDTQIGKLRNIEVLSGKEKKAAKEKSDTFNDEIKNLEKSIVFQKEILRNRLETNEAIRIGLEADLERAKTDEERFEIQERIRELESRSLEAQENAYNTIVGLVAQYQGKLQEAGLSTEETAKAAKKLESILLGVSGLDVGFKELADSAKRFAKDFKKTFGEQLKDGKELTESQQEFVNTYIDGLIEKFGTASPEQKEALRGILSSLLFAGGDEDEFKDIAFKVIKDVLKEAEDVFDEFNETYLENKKAVYEAELDELKRKTQIEQDILKAQLDNQLITESQFRAKSLELQKAQLAKENTINKKIFDAERKQERNEAIADGFVGVTEATINAFSTYKDPITASIVAAIMGSAIIGATALKLSAINQRKFVPKKFAEGGMVSGPSHNEGGVPFSVQGQGGYEMEGGEFIVNKRATAKHYDLLQRINDSYRTAPKMGRMKFADGGLINSPMNESVDYLKAIADATTQSAIQGSKPVRAFVSAKDLRTNENERRLRDRNDRI